MTQIDRITLGQYEWTYFAQGQANVLFQARTGLPGKLLRLRLNRPENPSAIEIYNYIRHELRPLHRFMAPVQLVQVDTPLLESFSAYNVDSKENYALLVDEVGFGPPGLKLTLEVESKLAAALVTTRDFVHEATNQRVKVHTVEFKPKWLLQSPNAPKDAKYCRTCALRRMRAKKPSFCPLDLVAHDNERLRRCCKVMLEGKHDELLEPLLNFLKRSNICGIIKEVQKSDVKGILGYASHEDVDNGFNRAMTARDFTVIVELIENDREKRKDFKVRGSIIDMDLKRYKPGTAKRKHIEQTERALIRDWYRG